MHLAKTQADIFSIESPLQSGRRRRWPPAGRAAGGGRGAARARSRHVAFDTRDGLGRELFLLAVHFTSYLPEFCSVKLNATYTHFNLCIQ